MPKEEMFLWLGLVSLATFLISLVTLPFLITKIPADYFSSHTRTPSGWKNAHPSLRILLLILKNFLGVILLAGGILMLFLPGQGLLTLAMGMMLMDYPGKYKLERRIVSFPLVLKGLNWLRRKRGAPAFVLDTP